MRRAYVLITVDVGSEGEILEALKQIPEVRQAQMVYGVYDIIARVEADTTQELSDVVNLRIRSLDQIGAVLTLRCVEASDGG